VAPKPDVVCTLKCWQGRKVLLHRSTLVNHVVRLHIESAFVLDQLKRKFDKPICVVKNHRHNTLNAYYDIEVDGQPYLLVAIKFQRKLAGVITRKPHFIKSFYGVQQIPDGPYEWGRKP
jgi:hypothetical protein